MEALLRQPAASSLSLSFSTLSLIPVFQTSRPAICLYCHYAFAMYSVTASREYIWGLLIGWLQNCTKTTCFRLGIHGRLVSIYISKLVGTGRTPNFDNCYSGTTTRGSVKGCEVQAFSFFSCNPDDYTIRIMAVIFSLHVRHSPVATVHKWKIYTMLKMRIYKL